MASKIDNIKTEKEIKDRLVSTDTSIVTPNLGKRLHHLYSYFRCVFIARVLEYMIHLAGSYKIFSISEDILLEAMGRTSWFFSYSLERRLKILLQEMVGGLGLLELEVIDEPNAPYGSKTINYYKLSTAGYQSYKDQVYQTLVTQMHANIIGRILTYCAVIIALIALFK